MRCSEGDLANLPSFIIFLLQRPEGQRVCVAAVLEAHLRVTTSMRGSGDVIDVVRIGNELTTVCSKGKLKTTSTASAAIAK